MPAWWPHSDGSAAAPPRSQAIFSELCSLILLRLLDRRDVESHEPHTQNAHWSFRRSSCRWFVLLTASLVSLFNNYISFNPYNLQQIQNTIITIINSVKCVFFFMYYVWVVYWIYILLLNTTLAMKCVLRLKSVTFFKATRNVNHQVEAFFIFLFDHFSFNGQILQTDMEHVRRWKMTRRRSSDVRRAQKSNWTMRVKMLC